MLVAALERRQRLGLHRVQKLDAAKRKVALATGAFECRAAVCLLTGHLQHDLKRLARAQIIVVEPKHYDKVQRG